MDPVSWVAEYGLFGLLIFAFLAATIIPISSEVAVLAALQFGLAPGAVLLFAAIGNCLGAMTNYVLGLVFTKPVLTRLRRRPWTRQAVAWARRYGGWSLAASWMPFVGDAVTLVGGIFRFHLRYLLVLGLGTRIIRYIIFIGLVQYAKQGG